MGSTPERPAARRAERPRAVVVGSGPNGLAAAIHLAASGCSVAVREGRGEAGGGLRSAALTLPGFVHDVCSAVHPLAVGSPFLAALPLARHGLRWRSGAAELAHPLDDGSVALLFRSLDDTARELGRGGAGWRRLLAPFVRHWPAFAEDALGPVLHVPRHPWLLARLAARAIAGARALARTRLATPQARALFAGIAAHASAPLSSPASAAVGLVLASAGHAVGLPVPEGGAARLAAALVAHLEVLGGRIERGAPVRDLRELPPSDLVLLDCTPRQVLALAGDALPPRYRQRLARYRYGPAVFKMDWALAEPIPWRAPACALAPTVHLGGTLEQIAAAEDAVARGEHPARPFVLLAQPTLVDPSRAPAGRHVAWAYAHVPHGSTRDVSAAIEAQIERFAPGFREIVLARRTWDPAALERENPNLVGGDISGGSVSGLQFPFRPMLRLDPYATPVPGLYLCSSSTPPGPGVHGLCGWHAARRALRHLERGRSLHVQAPA